MTVFRIFVVLGYLAILVGIGFYTKSRAKSVEGFAVAGRKLAFYTAMSTIVASEWGGGVVMGVTEDAHSFGISSYIYPLAMGLGLIILGLTLAKKYWHMDTITMGQFLNKRFSARVDVLAAVLMVLSITLVTGSQVRAAGLVGSTIFGIPFVLAAVIFVIAFCIYTSIGGLWAVAFNDTFQLLVGAVGLIIVLVVAMSRAGNVSTLIKQLPAGFLDPRPYGSWKWAVDYFASVTFVMLAVPELVQRIWGCKTVKSAQASLVVGGIVYWLFGIVSILLGMYTVILVPNLQGSALPSLIVKLFNPYLAVVLCLSILAALLSTADTMLLVSSTMFVEDIYKRIFKPNLSPETTLKLMRVMIFVFGAITLVWAILVPRILSLIIYSMYVIVGYSTIYIFGHIWKKTSEIAALGCLIITAAVTSLWFFADLSSKTFLTTGTVAFGISIIAVVILSLLFPNKELAKASKTG
jgi:SSS family solute:Na+ symporter